MNCNTNIPCWEHFEHGADIGIRGLAPTLAQAFEQAAIAMTAVISDPTCISPSSAVALQCEALDVELLFLSWINELIYQMAVRGLLFNRYQVSIQGSHLSATAYGEPIDLQKHQPAVEIKGATFTELQVRQRGDATWLAQCVVDVEGILMDITRLIQRGETCWEVRPHGAMRVPAIIYADQQLLQDMDQKVYEQICNVAALPGIVQAAYAMPDAHWGLWLSDRRRSCL